MDTVQVFTKNQQQWKVPPLKDETILEWRAELARLGWARTKDAHARTVSTPPTSSTSPARPRPLEEVRGDDDRGGQSVRGPGDRIPRPSPRRLHLRHARSGTELIASAYAEIFEKTAGFSTVSCFENTAGGGSLLGGSFDHLAELRAKVIQKVGNEAAARIAFCFDTCHAHAAGYDMSSREAATAALDTFDRTCGLESMAVLHLNDSKGSLGSHLDRHEHIGKGEIGLHGFTGVLNHPVLARRARPMILETPKGATEKGDQWDTVNLRQLRKLIAVTPGIVTPRTKTPARASRGGVR